MNEKISRQKIHQSYYFGKLVPKGNFFGDIAASEIIRLSKKYIGKNILDIGAGSGALINLLPKNSVGIDLNSKHPKVIEGSIDHMPFNANNFDTIFCIEVLEHLDENTLREGLKEIFRTLKNGGNFILTVPYNEDLKTNIVICPKCENKFHKVGYVRSFTDENLSHLLANFGFNIRFIKIIPIGIMSRYPLIKHFLIIFNKLIPDASKNIFLIANKSDY